MKTESQPCISFQHPPPPVDMADYRTRYRRQVEHEKDVLVKRLNDLLCPCCFETRPLTPCKGVEVLMDDTLPDALKGEAYHGQITASGGAEPYTFTLLTGALPPGLSLDTNTGSITGTPT